MSLALVATPDTSDLQQVWDDVVAFRDSHKHLPRTEARVTATWPHPLPLGIVFTSDWHIGSVGCDMAKLRKDLQTISDYPNLYCVVGGDGIDNFVQETKMKASRSQIVPSATQISLFRMALSTVKDKVLALGRGNHDGWSRELADYEPMKEVGRELGIPYVGDEGVVEVKMVEGGKVGQSYTILRRHKYHGESKDDPTVAIVKMYDLGNEVFDIGVLEHRHVGVIKTFWRHGKERFAIRTGSYKVRDGYARELGFANVEPRTPMVILLPGGERRILAFPDMREGVEVLRALSGF